MAGNQHKDEHDATPNAHVEGLSSLLMESAKPMMLLQILVQAFQSLRPKVPREDREADGSDICKCRYTVNPLLDLCHQKSLGLSR